MGETVVTVSKDQGAQQFPLKWASISNMPTHGLPTAPSATSPPKGVICLPLIRLWQGDGGIVDEGQHVQNSTTTLDDALG